MSFARTLVTLAAGFAAYRGVQKLREAGGVDAIKDSLRSAGEEGGMADRLAQQAEKLGLPIDSAEVRDAAARMGKQAADMTEATESNVASMIAAASSVAQAGMSQMGALYEKVAANMPFGEATEDNARLMIRAMIAAAKADGEISAEERKDIMDKLGDATEEEMAFVQEALDGEVDLAAIARDAGETAKEQVYNAALMATKADTDAERTFLKNLANVLGLDDAQVAELHDKAGVKSA